MTIPYQQFSVDVLNNSDVVQGAGPLFNVVSVEITEELDRAGRVAVTVPASDERAIALLGVENRLRVRTPDGNIAYGLVEKLDVAAGQKPLVTASGPDALGELVHPNAGYDRVYDDLAVAAAIIGTTGTATSLLGGTGWTQGSVDTGLGDATISYNGETILEALCLLAEQLGKHFRQGTTARTLDFGAFGVDSGVRITNLAHVLAVQEDADDLAYVGQVAVGEIGSDIENRIYPQAKYAVDLRHAPSTITDIEVRRNPGPTGAASTLSAPAGASSASITVADGSDFVDGEIVWLGDADDWTADHETKEVATVVGNTINFVGTTQYAHGAGADVIQQMQFYVEDTTSQGVYGVREGVPQFSWIEAVDTTTLAKQNAGNMLYLAAKARLAVFKDSFKSYRLGQVFNLPHDLRAGEKVRLVYKGAVEVYGGTLYLDIDDDFFVIRITRRFEGDGKRVATLEVANVDRPSANDGDFVADTVAATRRSNNTSSPADIEVPIGSIVMWSGAIGTIPAGWQLCDGSGGTPDLRDRFLVGAGNSYAVAATGGAATNDLQHGHAVGTLALGAPSTLAAMTADGVDVAAADHVHTITGNTADAGSTAQENRPPYYALAFIMRVS